MLIERFVLVLHVVRRRWRLALLPLLLLVPLAAYLAYATSVKYVSKSVILLQSANRSTTSSGSAAFPRHAVIEQISVIEAWLKSDHILGGLLPQLTEGAVPSDPISLQTELAILRRALVFELVGNAVLEVRLEGVSSKGLGRKLEIIITRLLEGMLSPDDGILSAERMVALRRSEALHEMEQALNLAIDAVGNGPTDAVKGKLAQIYSLQKESLSRSAGLTEGRNSATIGMATDRPAMVGEPGQRGALRSMDKARLEQQLAAERSAMALDTRVLERLERQYATFEEARSLFDSAKQTASARSDTYVRVFDAPANLTVVGRPRDPLFGESSRRKLFVAGLFVSLVMGAALIVVAELLDPSLLGRQDFESIAGIPVIARLSKIQLGDIDQIENDPFPPAMERPTWLGRFSFRDFTGGARARAVPVAGLGKAPQSPAE
jgi:hypothetical protein